MFFWNFFDEIGRLGKEGKGRRERKKRGSRVEWSGVENTTLANGPHSSEGPTHALTYSDIPMLAYPYLLSILTTYNLQPTY